MAKAKDNWTPEDQDEYDASFEGVSEDQSNLGAWIMVVVGYTATAQILNKLSESDLAIVKENSPEWLEVTPVKMGEAIDQVMPLQEFTIDKEFFSFFIEEQDLQFGINITEDLKQYGRVSDPKSVENIAWNNQERMLDRIGMFGNNESTKSGLLDTYIKNNSTSQDIILIPWIDAGANTCDECMELTLELYLPEDYPEPPHYGCECLPGDPIVVQALDVGEDLRLIIAIY